MNDQDTTDMLQGAPACYEYLVKKYGKKGMPLKKCTFIKILSLETIPHSFRPAGSTRAHRWYKPEAVEEWYQKSIGAKL